MNEKACEVESVDREGEEVGVRGSLADQGEYQPLPFLYVKASLV